MRSLIFLAVALVPSCDQQKQPPPQAATPKATLSVTWLVPGQPPATTITPMSDLAVCEKAKAKALLAGEEARNERTRLNEKDKAEASASLQRAGAGGAIITGLSPEQERKFRGVALPQVSAYCAEQ